MEKTAIDAVASSVGSAAVKRRLGEALGTTAVAVNYYELDPGDSFAFGYHVHEDQEEVFYVKSGTATFETADGLVEVGPEEVVRFAPGEYQRGTNEGEERVVALALGAPRDAGTTEVRRTCPDCGDRTAQAIRREEPGEALVTTCEVCGAETGRFS